MKKVIFTGVVGLFLALFINVTAKGQAAIAKAELPKDLTYHKKPVSDNDVRTVNRSEVNQKAVRNFSQSFKGSPSEKWYDVEGGFIAEFNSGDIDYRVDYNKKGSWLRTIRTYGEDKLPEDIRHMVRSTYYDFDIMLVQEVENPFNVENPLNTVTYIVQLDGKTQHINLKIYNGEMEEWQKFNKAK